MAQAQVGVFPVFLCGLPVRGPVRRVVAKAYMITSVSVLVVTMPVLLGFDPRHTTRL
jgi:hypothetical protein